MSELIHTCYRITDIDRSVAFYKALGFEEMRAHADPRRGDQRLHEPARRRDKPRLELTYNFGVDSYELGTGYGHIAITADDLDATLEQPRSSRGSSPRSRPTRCARAARACASCATRTATASS